MIEFYADISEVSVMQRQIIEAMRWLAGNGDNRIEAAMNGILAAGAEYAAEISPFISGALSSSIYPVVERVGPISAEGRITLAHVENPLFGGYTDVYGPTVHNEGAFGGLGPPKPFMADTAEHMESELIPGLANELEYQIVGIFS